MPTLTIEPDPTATDDPPPPDNRGRLLLAAAVAALLLVGIIALNTRPSRTPQPTAAASTTTSAGARAPVTTQQPQRPPTTVAPPTTRAPAATAPVAPSTTARPTTTAPAAPATTAIPAEPDEVTAARRALDGWVRYVATRDLAALAPAFDPAGPQHAQLANEAGWTPVAGYGVDLTNPTVTASTANQATVTGSVTWRRPGEANQTFTWDLVLRRHPDGWKLWTVTQK